MKLHDISDKFRAHLRAAGKRLSGTKAAEEEQRPDIDRIVRLHCEAELVRLTALVQLAVAKGESIANPQYVTVLDFDCIAQQKALGNPPNAHEPFTTRNHDRL